MTIERALLLLDSKAFNKVQNGRYNIEDISLEDAEQIIGMMNEVGEVASCFVDDGIGGVLHSELPKLDPRELFINESAILFHRSGGSYSCKIVTKLDEFNIMDFVS